MNDVTPTRSLLIALADDRRTMREGAAFLDEKCLVLAGALLRQLRRYRELASRMVALRAIAQTALRGAAMRHGLTGLQTMPPAAPAFRLVRRRDSLLGVALLDVQLVGEAAEPAPAVYPSPEATACRMAFAQVAAALVELAAVSSNLARLLAEYLRTVRRVRALQDVLLPEIEQSVADVDTRLEDLEREDAVITRRVARRQPLPG
jgi:V/A-type H+/Na+-transporting ATPase subunit D